MTPDPNIPLRQFRSHPRDWHDNAYVYPVISRRSRGLSIGVNLNPDGACNFDCVYCQVDRSGTPRVRDVDPDRLADELERMIDDAGSGALFADPSFADVPTEMRVVRDIAFSGDGEPTTSKHFRECVEIAARLKRDAGLHKTKLTLITDACYLTKPEVVAGLTVLDENQGEVWAKLDAGTQAYYERVNRPNYALEHVIENITATARVRPVVIQSLFMRLHDEAPGEAEILAFTDRLGEIQTAGGRIDHVQVYTVARRPAEDYVAPLTNAEVDQIADLVRTRAGLSADVYYSGA